MNTEPRTCDDCSKCCEGWLNGDAHGHVFYPGRPCHFFANGCSIYADRPAEPCRSYRCAWLESDELPMWMRPDLCKAIVTKRVQDGIEFYDVLEAGQVMDAKVLSWFVLWALNTQRNLSYAVNGIRNRIGSPEFLALQL